MNRSWLIFTENGEERLEVGRVTTNVSIEADRDYVLALKILARQRRTTVGKLVRQALDGEIGDVMGQARLFFADSEPNVAQVSHERVEDAN